MHTLRKIEATSAGDLSEHFSRAEFACHCCGQLKVDNALIPALEQLRALATQLAGEEKPIIVHDAYRCSAHNQQVGGVPNSEHTLGLAADISIPGLPMQQMYELALQIPTFFNGGIGVYDSDFLHVDTRARQARWARVSGKYVAIHALVTTPPALLARLQSNGPATTDPGNPPGSKPA